MNTRLLSCLALISAAAIAQISQPLAFPVPVSVSTGVLSHNQPGIQSVFTHTISMPGASSLQVVFETARLGSDEDAIVVTGVLDGETQTLDRLRLKQWRNHSAWFNGSAVTVDVRLAQGSTAQIVVSRVFAGTPPPAGPDTICGATDNRALTTDARCCRLVTSATSGCSGCSGFLINNRSTILSAGHCANPVPDWLVVAEFNFGISAANGCITHPPVADQHPVDQSTIQQSDNGRGDDWSVARLHPNSSGQTASARQGTWFTLAGAMPANGSTLRVTGNGYDDTPNLTYNYALQTTTGTQENIVGDEIRHRVDTEGGNSGSAIINNANGQAIGIHTHGGCDTTAGSYNSGTRILKAALQTAITNTSGCAAVSLNSGTSAAINCTPAIYDVGPAANRWTGVGITSTSDWDLNLNVIGSTATVSSAYGGSTCDFLIANGHFGTVDPVSGEMYRFAGADTARGECHDAITTTVGTTSSTTWSSTRVLRLFEFNVTSAGTFDITVTGDPALDWRLYAPGTSEAWRPRSSAVAASGAVGGATSSSIALSTGWHCLVVFKDGGVAAVANTALSVTVCTSTISNALTANTPEVITAPCQDFTVAPTAGIFNVVAISSPSSWAVALGGGFSNTGGSDADFVIADGHAGAITPTWGQFVRNSGTDSATAEHRTATTLTIGSAATAALNVGAVSAVRQFNVTTAGTYQFTVTGAAEAGTFFRVFDSGGSAAWRPRADSLVLSAVGSAPVSLALAAGWHALVIYKNAGPATVLSSMLVQVCQTAAAVTLGGFTPLTVSGPCETFTCTPDAGLWNAVGVSSTSDWDIGIGDAYSFLAGSTTDFAVSNGHLGTISPTSGGASRFSGSADARLQRSYNISLTVGTTYSANWPANYVVRMFEFQVPAADDYDITLSGAAELGWRLYAPGADAAWRSRQAEIPLASGTAGGTTATVSLAAGWHGIAVYRDGGAAAATLPFTVLAELTPNPVPAISSLNPASVVAGAATFPMTVNGTGFYAGTVIRWNGANLPTAFVNANQVTATVAAALVASAGTASVTAFNGAPGGGLSAAATFTIDNPVPVLNSIAPTARTAGGAAFTLNLNGSGFNSQTVPRWNGNPLPIVTQSSTLIQATVAAALIATPGTATVTAFNPLPGGGSSVGRTFTINHPAPTITTTSPISVVAGGPGFTLTVNGTGFFNGTSVIRWNGVDLTTAFGGPTQLTANVAASLIASAGSASIRVFNPAPGGGLSGTASLPILAPIVASVAPSTIAVMTLASPPVPLTITGGNFLPTTVVYANSSPLPTVYGGPGSLTALLGPSVAQTLEIGGIAIAVENGHVAWSNARGLRVGVGSNQGTVVRHPLNPLPGEAYAAFLEGGYPLAPFTLVVDLTHPAPVHPFPDPTGDFVLSVRPFAPPGDPTWLAFDGIGIYGPSIGLAFDATGQANFPGFVAPNPPLGVDLTVQSVYLDPTAIYGFRLGWARWPDSL